MRLCHVVDVGRRAHHRVHQDRVRIHTDVGFHSKVPLIAFLGLVHLGVAFAEAVLGRTRRGNERGIDHGPALEQQTLGRQRGVDSGKDLQAQVVGFEQVAEPKNGALVGQVVFPGIQTHELAEQRHVVQRFLHRRVREVEPLLDEVDAQHGLDGERWASALGARGRCMWRDQRHQLCPGHHEVHLIEELALARSFGLALESVLAQAHLLHAGNVSHQARAPRLCRPSLRCGFYGNLKLSEVLKDFIDQRR